MNREIIRLSVPVMIGMLSHTMIQIADTAMVGRLGTTPLAAVGLGSLFTHVVLLVCGALSVGTQAITARRLGEKRLEEFGAIALNSSVVALVLGLVVSITGYALSPWIFSNLSENDEVVTLGTGYMSIRLLGLFSFIVMFALSGFVYGAARVKIDMAVSLIVNACNVTLNYFLIYGHWFFPRLEVRGAAIASVISTFIGLAVFVYLVTVRVLWKLPAPRPRPSLSRELMWQIVRISWPRAIQSASIAGFLIFLSLIGKIGVRQLAISNVIVKAFDFSFMVGVSFGAASATLVGRSLGERNEALASRYGWHSIGLGSLAMGTIGVSFVFFPREIMSVFTADTEAIEMGVVPFRLLGAFQCVDAIGIILSRTLQGVGSTLYVMIAEMICMWIVFIPLTYVATAVMRRGLVAAWVALYLYIVCFAGTMFWKFREGGWKRIRI